MSISPIIRTMTMVLLGATWGLAQRGYPRINTVFPGAVSQGTTTEVTLTGHYNLKEAYKVVFEGEGLSAKIGEWIDLSGQERTRSTPAQFKLEGLRLKITVARNAVPGIRQFRVVTKGSLSTMAKLLVTDVETSNEVEPNDSTQEAQSIEVPRVINGLLQKAVDEDVYKFRAKAGDRLSFVVHAARLQNAIPHLEGSFADITISLRDEKGKELASADDYHGQDPLLFYSFDRDGTYYLHLWEATYQSGMAGKELKWWYALSILKSPYVTSVLPLVVHAGTKVRLHPRGFNLAGLEEVEVDVSRDGLARKELQLTSPQGSSNLVTLRVIDLPQMLEPARQERPGGAQKIQLPIGINGCIAADREVDRYRFAAQKGQRFEFEVEAYRYGSALDSLLEVHDSDGKLLAAGDDMLTTSEGMSAFGNYAFPVEKDSRIEWIAPADGEYELRVRDANYFGSKDHVYYLAAKFQKEDFTLVLDDGRIPLGPGESIARVVTVERRNGFDGEVKLSVRGLPKGVQALESYVPAGWKQANLVLTAAADAPMDVRDVEVVGSAMIKSSDGRLHAIERIAKAFETFGEAGQTNYSPVRTATVAVAEASDLILECSPKEFTLHPGESVTVRVKITRNKYKGPLELNVIVWNLTQRLNKLPEGIVLDELHSRTSLAENETEGQVTLRALPHAVPFENQQMVVLGQITYNRVFMTRVAAPFRMTVARSQTAVMQK